MTVGSSTYATWRAALILTLLTCATIASAGPTRPLPTPTPQRKLAGRSTPRCSSNALWEKLPPMQVAMGEVACDIVRFNNDDHLCCVGEASASTQCYNLRLRTWKARLQRNKKGNHHCQVSYNGKMYLVGGLDGGSERALQVLDSGSGRWRIRAPLPFSAGSASCGVYGNKLTVCGGIDGSQTGNRCARYDFASNRWSAAPNMKEGRNHAAYCSAGRKMWVVGGRTGRNRAGKAYKTCQVYDLVTGKSGSCPDMRYPVGGAGQCVRENGRLWVLGGELNRQDLAKVNVGHNGGALKQVTVLHRGTWKTCPDMLVGKHGIMPKIYKGYVYVAAGGIKSAKSSSNSMYRAKLSDLLACCS